MCQSLGADFIDDPYSAYQLIKVIMLIISSLCVSMLHDNAAY